MRGRMHTGWQTLGDDRPRSTPPHVRRPRDLARRREAVECMVAGR